MKNILTIIIMFLAVAGYGKEENKFSQEKKEAKKEITKEVSSEITRKITQKYSNGDLKEVKYYLGNIEIAKVTYDDKGNKTLVCVEAEYEKNRDSVTKLLHTIYLSMDNFSWDTFNMNSFENCLMLLQEYSILRNDTKALKALIDFSPKADAALGEVLVGIITAISFEKPKMFLETLVQYDDEYKNIIINNNIYPREMNKENSGLVSISIKKDDFLKKWIQYVDTTKGDINILGNKIINNVEKQ